MFVVASLMLLSLYICVLENLMSMLIASRGYIGSFQVKNVWGYKTFTWNKINPDVNILVGINGCGKTTLLNLMLAATIEDTKVLRSYNVNDVDICLARGFDRSGSVHFIRSFDTPANDKRKNESQLLQQLNYVLFQNKEGFSFFNYRMRILDEPYKAVEIQQNIDLLFSVINEMFSETGKSVEISKDNTSQLVFRQGDKLLSVENLSSGEKQLLLLLITVFLQDRKPAVLFADEPEVSLHISWQQVLIDNLRRLNPNCQIILATHSPSIISRGWGDKVVQMSSITK